MRALDCNPGNVCVCVWVRLWAGPKSDSLKDEARPCSLSRSCS